MKNDELIQHFPTKRIKAIDGLTVTADVWEEAHDYHRQHLRYHAVLNHGAGIVTGLEVIASDPADTSVYVRPGIAVDSDGRTIVVVEPTAYDIGRSMDGPLYLVLSYDEGRPVSESNGNSDGSPLYIHTHFSIAAAPALPDSPHVELARIRRTRRDASVTDAKDASHPAANEIDLRYRREIGVPAQAVTSIAVSYLGGQNARHGAGLNYAAKALSQGGSRRVFVDDGIELRSGLDRYALVYLVATGDFQMSPDDMTALYAYVQAGGTVLFESCRHDGTGKPKGDATFLDIVGSFGFKLTDLPSGHELLTNPLLFAAPPAGFETQSTPAIQIADGIIVSTADYGCLWQGERRGAPPSREEIRAATEWAGNAFAYAVQRRAKAVSH